MDDRADDRRIALLRRQAADEGAVDLQPPDREALQVRQARVAGAEVVDREPHAERGQRLQAQHRVLRILDQDRFGEFELEQPRRQSGFAHCVRHAVDEARLLELQRRDVHGDRHFGAARAPHGSLGYGTLEHPVADRDDEAAFLGHRDELARRDFAQLRIAPTDQRLGADDAAGTELDLRLVVQAEPPLRERHAHRVIEPHA